MQEQEAIWADGASAALGVLMLGAVYAITAGSAFTVAKRRLDPSPGLAFIPFVGPWIAILRSIGTSAWWVVVLFVPVASLVFAMWTAFTLPARHLRTRWWGLVFLVPLLNLIAFYVYALTLPEAGASDVVQQHNVGNHSRESSGSSHEVSPSHARLQAAREAGERGLYPAALDELSRAIGAATEEGDVHVLQIAAEVAGWIQMRAPAIYHHRFELLEEQATTAVADLPLQVDIALDEAEAPESVELTSGPNTDALTQQQPTELETTASSRDAGTDAAVEIVRVRYAEGRINREEFLQILADLQTD